MDELILEAIKIMQALEALAYSEGNDVARSLANRTQQDLMWLYRDVVEYKPAP